jgi:hypothetical protein
LGENQHFVAIGVQLGQQFVDEDEFAWNIFFYFLNRRNFFNEFLKVI